MKITIEDENFAGRALQQILLEIEQDTCTLKELIEKRVEAEVEKFNELLPKYFTGLVQPNESEATLNGYLVGNRRKIDVEKQIFVALAAFNKNGYFVLVDNEQVTELDAIIELHSERKISFIKLTPLVGG
ncbi:MAG: hypothetical protein ACRBG0_09335 [Lewinella sp.]|jgi:hypothetical protein|uniref:hypothetical protein n=1 Tax=Lewinella sp. TaxID=2004506 RepID=UPI003D6BDE53